MRRWVLAAATTPLLAFAAYYLYGMGERVVASVDQPHRVEIVRYTEWPSGGILYPLRLLEPRETSCFVRVYLDSICGFAISCESDRHEVRAYPEKSLVAVRVADSWHAVRFAGNGAFYDCRPPLGNGRAPDFQHLDSLADAVERILSCARRPDRSKEWVGTCGSLEDLAAGIRETSGSQAVAALFDRLARTSSQEGELNHSLWMFPSGDWWSTDFRTSLMRSEKAILAERLCSVLRDPNSDPRATLRAAQLCPIDALGVAEAALSRFKAHLALPKEHLFVGDSKEGNLAHMVFSWSAIAAARGLPKEAGDAACALVGIYEGSRRTNTALAIVAATKTRCPAVLRQLQTAPCPRKDECSDPSCDSAATYEALRRWLYDGAAAYQDPFASREDYQPEAGTAILLAAARHFGPLPEWARTRIARRSYARHEPDDPSCTSDHGPPGEPCSCGLSQKTRWFCSLPLDGSFARLGPHNCEVRADDKKKLVGFPRRFCLTSKDAEPCSSAADCCLGYSCVWRRCREKADPEKPENAAEATP